MGISVGVSVGAIVLFITIVVCVVGGVMAAVASSRRSRMGSNSTTYSQTTLPQSYTDAGTDTTDKQGLLPVYTEQTTDAYSAPYPSQPQNTYPLQET